MAKGKKKKKVRNWIAVEAHFTPGAGDHGSKKKYNRKTKHKKKGE